MMEALSLRSRKKLSSSRNTHPQPRIPILIHEEAPSHPPPSQVTSSTPSQGYLAPQKPPNTVILILYVSPTLRLTSLEWHTPRRPDEWNGRPYSADPSRNTRTSQRDPPSRETKSRYSIQLVTPKSQRHSKKSNNSIPTKRRTTRRKSRNHRYTRTRKPIPRTNNLNPTN